MKLKSLFLIVLALAAISVAVYVVRRPAADVKTDSRIGQRLTDGVMIDQTATLGITDQGKSVNLVRQTDGSWRVASYFDLPADFQKLSTFVTALTDAKIQRLVTTNAGRLARLDFNGAKIELTDKAGKEMWSVDLGKTAESGGRYIRYGTEQKAYLADFSAWLDTEPKNWADSHILNLKPEEIARVEISWDKDAGDNVILTRAKKEDSWSATQTPAGQRINAGVMTSLLSSLTTLRFTDTTELADSQVIAAKEHERAVKLTTFDGKHYAVAMGRKPEEKKLKPPAAASEKKEDATAASGPQAAGAAQPESPATPPKPEYETIPAGPVYAFVSTGNESSPVDVLMRKRAFQIADYSFTSLPQTPESLFEAIPAPAPNEEKSDAAKTGAGTPGQK